MSAPAAAAASGKAPQYNMLGGSTGAPTPRGRSPRRLVTAANGSSPSLRSAVHQPQVHNTAYAAVYQRRALQIKVPRDRVTVPPVAKPPLQAKP